jgi:biopolymer transport protein ExbD
VSLVLLIFFMMTAAISSGVFSPIPTPEAKHQLAEISTDMLWLGIEKKKDGTLFSLGKDSERKKYLVDPTDNDDAVVEELTKILKDTQGEFKIRLRADKSLPIEMIKNATLGLQKLEGDLNRGREPSKKLTIIVLGEVSEPTK